MNGPNPDAKINRLDWRENLRSLPVKAEPEMPVYGGVFCLLPGLILMGISSLLAVVVGACAGLSGGLSPDESGGTIHFIFGAIFCTFLGAVLAALATWRKFSRSISRVLFYSFFFPAAVIIWRFSWQALTFILSHG